MNKSKKIFWFTVGELRNILNKHPENMPVVISGKDNGFENFFLPEEIDIAHLPDNYYKDGEFQVTDGKNDRGKTYTVLALVRNERE